MKKTITKAVVIKKLQPTTGLIERETSNLIENAESIIIENEKQKSDATILLSQTNKMLDRVTFEKEKVTRPLNEALKAERGRWKPIEATLESAILILRKKLGTYQTEQKRIADEKEAKIIDRVGEGKGKFSADTAVRKLDEIEKPSEVVNTNAGTIKFRTDKKFEVTDLAQLPLEYHMANEVSIRVAMKNGVELPGVRYWEEQVPINYR